MQVNGYNKSQVSFQGNLLSRCPKAGEAVGQMVKLGTEELLLLKDDLITTLTPRAKKEISAILEVFEKGATVVRDEFHKNPSSQRIVIAKNDEGKIASISAKDLDILA